MAAETLLATSEEAPTYRRDRWGEAWHIVPAGPLATHGRTACGEPRQGTVKSESYATQAPTLPEQLCPRCAAVRGATMPAPEPSAARPFPEAVRDLTPLEQQGLARCLAVHHPTRQVTRAYVAWDQWLVVESAHDVLVIETRMLLSHLQDHRVGPGTDPVITSTKSG